MEELEKSVSSVICQRNFFSNTRLERHRRTHTGAKPFVCELCGSSYQQLNDLVRHQRKHDSGSREGFPCPVEGCGKMLATINSLNVHKRIHTGEKPHVCSTCGKSFRTNSAARRHNIVHTGERKFACDICSKLYQTPGHLKQHSRVHRGPAADSANPPEFANKPKIADNSVAHSSDEGNEDVTAHAASLEFSIPPDIDVNLATNLANAGSHGVCEYSSASDNGFQPVCDIDSGSDALVTETEYPLKETLQIFIDSRPFNQAHHPSAFQLFNQSDL